MARFATMAAFCLLAVILVACGVGNAPNNSPKTYNSREEFSRLVVGRTPGEVVDLLGSPSETKQGNGKNSGPDSRGYDGTFIYRPPQVSVIDKTSGKASDSVYLYFSGRKVDHIAF